MTQVILNPAAEGACEGRKTPRGALCSQPRPGHPGRHIKRSAKPSTLCRLPHCISDCISYGFPPCPLYTNMLFIPRTHQEKSYLRAFLRAVGRNLHNPSPSCLQSLVNPPQWSLPWQPYLKLHLAFLLPTPWIPFLVLFFSHRLTTFLTGISHWFVMHVFFCS